MRRKCAYTLSKSSDKILPRENLGETEFSWGCRPKSRLSQSRKFDRLTSRASRFTHKIPFFNARREKDQNTSSPSFLYVGSVPPQKGLFSPVLSSLSTMETMDSFCVADSVYSRSRASSSSSQKSQSRQPQELQVVLVLNPQTCSRLLPLLPHRLPCPPFLVSQVQHGIVPQTPNLLNLPILSLYPQFHPLAAPSMRLHLPHFRFMLFDPILSTRIGKFTDLEINYF